MRKAQTPNVFWRGLLGQRAVRSVLEPPRCQVNHLNASRHPGVSDCRRPSTEAGRCQLVSAPAPGAPSKDEPCAGQRCGAHLVRDVVAAHCSTQDFDPRKRRSGEQMGFREPLGELQPKQFVGGLPCPGGDSQNAPHTLVNSGVGEAESASGPFAQPTMLSIQACHPSRFRL